MYHGYEPSQKGQSIIFFTEVTGIDSEKERSAYRYYFIRLFNVRAG
jgi:hypothetical protein